MIVDDDQFSVLLTRLKLKKYVGEKNIQVFNTVGSAIEYLEDQINGKTDAFPDLILIETMMEDGKGWEFFMHFEEMAKVANFPVKLIVLTSSQFFSDFRRSTRFSIVNGFLIKPLQIDQLIRLISQDKAGRSEILLNSFIA